MNLPVFIFLFLFVQVAAIALTLSVLMIILQRKMVLLTIHRIDNLLPKEFPEDLKEIEVTVRKSLPADLERRIVNRVEYKLGRILPVVVKKDKRIKGGIVIKFGRIVLDGSVIKSLREIGLAR